jgi:diacylglycerol kinase
VLLFNVALVLSLEIVNSSLENLVDLVMRERHPLAGKVKDLAAGAVVVAAGMAIVMGVIVFWPYVKAMLG